MKLSDKARVAAGLCAPASPQIQLHKVPSRNNYAEGPMGFLARQIVKRMASKGWPCKISELFRSPERQDQLYGKNSKARRWQSPHQWGLAADIIHASRGWAVPPAFWEDLAATVKVVEQEYGIDLVHGHYWRFRDSAHVEIARFREYRDRWGKRLPTQAELDQAFSELLPEVWKAYLRSPAGVSAGLRR